MCQTMNRCKTPLTHFHLLNTFALKVSSVLRRPAARRAERKEKKRKPRKGDLEKITFAPSPLWFFLRYKEEVLQKKLFFKSKGFFKAGKGKI